MRYTCSHAGGVNPVTPLCHRASTGDGPGAACTRIREDPVLKHCPPPPQRRGLALLLFLRVVFSIFLNGLVSTISQLFYYFSMSAFTVGV